VSTIDSEGAANIFLQRVVQDWPHHRPQQKIAAVQTVLDMVGFNARATCWAAFGAIWTQDCTGPDGPEATAWLKNLTKTLPRGSYDAEHRHIREAIDERIALMEGRLT
jgi:hypothetical protein